MTRRSKGDKIKNNGKFIYRDGLEWTRVKVKRLISGKSWQVVHYHHDVKRRRKIWSFIVVLVKGKNGKINIPWFPTYLYI